LITLLILAGSTNFMKHRLMLQISHTFCNVLHLRLKYS
jgi:hypothetical protein